MAKKKAAKKATPNLGGRPPKFKGQRLDKAVMAAFSQEQLDLVEQAAKLSGRKKSELLRDAALEEAKRIVDEAKRKPS